MLLAKEERVLQGMTDRLTEIGRHYGMEMNVKKNKAMRFSRQQYPIKIITVQKLLENVYYFNYWGSMITNDAMYTRKKIKNCHDKSCIQQEEDSFHQQIGLKFKKETSKMLHLEHSFL
jgi:hypothetical protein